MKAYLEPKEVALMERAATCFRDGLLIRLLFRLGCRVSEALALTVNDIDFDQGTMTIEHLESRSRVSCPKCGVRLGRSHTFCPKCGIKVEEVITQQQEHQRVRTLPVDKRTLHLLKEYVRCEGPVTRGGKQLIFGINRHRAWQIVRDCARQAQLPSLVNTETGKIRGVSPHRLRDAFSVHAMKVDDSSDGLRLLQEHLGHTNFNTTAKYRKIASEEHREWYDRLWR